MISEIFKKHLINKEENPCLMKKESEIFNPSSNKKSDKLDKIIKIMSLFKEKVN